MLSVFKDGQGDAFLLRHNCGFDFDEQNPLLLVDIGPSNAKLIKRLPANNINYFELAIMSPGYTPDEIEWANSRLICIAGDYTKYDSYAVDQINRNIELIRYKKYNELLLLELINAATGQTQAPPEPKPVKYSTVAELLEKSADELKDLYGSIRSFLFGLGDDIQEKELKFYFAFKNIRNFACVEIHPQTSEILVFLKVDPDSINLEKGFSRDVRKIGHFGTGDLEVKIKSYDDFEKAKPLLLKSYEIS